MALEMIKRYITSIIYSVILLGLLGVPLSVAAQQELTREERIKILEALKAEDEKTNISTVGLITSSMPTEIDKLELPPLSVFLDAVIENATVKRCPITSRTSQKPIPPAKAELVELFPIQRELFLRTI